MATSRSVSAPKGWFHRYPGRFPIEVAAEMLEKLRLDMTVAPTAVLDPFAGTGTTLSLLSGEGLVSIGCEINPLALLICSVRFFPPKDIPKTVCRLEEIVAKAKGDEPKWDINDYELCRWLGSANVTIARAALDRISMEENLSERKWMMLALSSALRPASSWLSGSIKPQLDPARVPPGLAECIRRASRMLERDTVVEGPTKAEVGLLAADACALPLESASVDAILTSPPYLTMYDYFDVQRLTFLAFGWPVASNLQVGKQSDIPRDGVGFVPPVALERWYKEIHRGEESSEGRAMRLYSQRMEATLREQFRVLRPGGGICYAVADSVRSQGTLELTKVIADLMKRSGFEVVRSEPRATTHRRILPSGRNPLTGRFSSTSIVPAVPEQILIALKR